MNGPCLVNEHMPAFLLGYLMSVIRWALVHPNESLLRDGYADVQRWQAEHQSQCVGKGVKAGQRR